MADNFENKNTIPDENGVDQEDVEHRDHLTSEQSSDLDQTHELHQDVTQESHHHGSHHHSGHSSHHKRHSSKNKKSLLERIERKIGQRGLLRISFAMILLCLVFIGCLFHFESLDTDVPDTDDFQDDYQPGGSNQQNPTPSVSQSVPSYWRDMIEEKTKTVKDLQTAGGKDCVSFVWASDTHIPDNSTARTDNLGILMAAMMDNCDIPFAVLTGDIGTRGSLDTEAELVRTQESIPVHLAPLWGSERLLLVLGNHDGCFGDSSNYYGKQFSPERMWQLYFRNQALDPRRVFSDDGLYYYVDNVAQKTRFIVLNSQFAGEYSVDSNGVATNNRFSTSCYGQKRLDWLAEVALDMPEGYGAVITAHVPPNVTYTVDKVQLIGIINAYCNKTTYSGSYTAGVDGWTNNSVSVDFSDAKGEIIAMFTGHVHQDTIDTTTLACPLITIISAGAQVNAGAIPDRTFGTDTETSFDVVTINRATRTIYCTRVGAGKDREIKY